MASARLNCRINGKYPALREHLKQYGHAAGERLKTLATIGAVFGSSCDEIPIGRNGGGSADGEVLRLNIRLSSAFGELADRLDEGTTRSGSLVRFAAVGLGLVTGSIEVNLKGDHVALNQNTEPSEAATDSASNSSDWIRLAGGLLQDNTMWQ
jgi:hypothetical protein|tara:strand:+ start:100 stop:558 length:459 start_codon:yes stop_codon:yes gene_type:complete